MIKKEINEFLISNDIEINNTNIRNNLKETTLNMNFLILKDDLKKLDSFIEIILDKYKFKNIELKKLNEIKPEDFDDEL